DAVARVLDETTRDPGTYRFAFTGADAGGAALPEGTWRWTVSATDDRGVASSAERQFSLDRTLGGLRVAPQSLRLPRSAGKSNAGPTLTVTATLERAA